MSLLKGAASAPAQVAAPQLPPAPPKQEPSPEKYDASRAPIHKEFMALLEESKRTGKTVHLTKQMSDHMKVWFKQESERYKHEQETNA